MSVNISTQDLEAINQLSSVIIPKIIIRLKAVEVENAGVQKQIKDLQEQVTLLHASTAKKTRSSKKKDLEVPKLVTPETPASTAYSYDPDDAAFYGDPVLTVINGVTINGLVIKAVQKCVQQGLIGSATIAESLQCDQDVVDHVLSLSKEEQERIIKIFLK